MPEPVQVLHLFPEERTALVDLLSRLSPDEWDRPTACSGWSVKDVALHILGGDLGNLSRRRDGFRGLNPMPGEDLVPFINRVNEEWVQAARRLSPRVIIDLLAFTGPQIYDLFSSLDLAATGGGVSWAGLEQAPVWLDVAREYTERWLHQQHIRDAVSKPGLTDRHFMGPVLSTFAYALPQAFRGTEARPGAAVQVHIAGEAGGDWSLLREEGGWALYMGQAESPGALVSMDQSVAWRLLTRGLTLEAGEAAVSITGNKQLGSRVLRAVAIIA